MGATSSNTSESKIFVIGSNTYGELGLGHTNYVTELTLFDKPHIHHIYPNNAFSIFTDNNNNYWACGYNKNGECGIGTNKSEINKLTKIKYFDKHNIKIKKICISTVYTRVYWISEDQKIYVHGKNESARDFNIGLYGYNKFWPEPTPIEYTNTIPTNDIMDIRSAAFYSIALCGTYDKFVASKILQQWTIETLPNELMKLITNFYVINEVYSTLYSPWGGNAQGQIVDDNFHMDNYSRWCKIDVFNDKNIKTIRTGKMHSVFLESNGNIWVCGDNHRNQLGINGDPVTMPTQIDYFIKHKVLIKYIECGEAHNLTIDFNKRIWSWGYNLYGQCGDIYGIKSKYVKKPKLIEKLQGLKIEKIGCGNYHSYCMTNDYKHYLFGNNEYNQCLVYESNKPSVRIPYCINRIVKSKCKAKINEVLLGCNNTIIICK
eukprot:207715_1